MKNLQITQHSIINTKGLDIANTKSFADFVAMAKLVEGQLKEAWGIVEQQMLERGVEEVTGEWGKIGFELAELLVVTDADKLDPAITKPALDTKKVRGYREVMGELPAGVGTKVITKFVKRVK